YSPCIAAYTAEPAQQDSGRPQAPCYPSGIDREGFSRLHLGERVKANSKNERTDPAEDLRLSMRLEPRLGNRFGPVTLRDAQEVPYTEKAAGKEHEYKPAKHKSCDYALTTPLTSDTCGIGSVDDWKLSTHW